MPRLRDKDFDLDTDEGKRRYYGWITSEVLPRVGWPPWPPRKGSVPQNYPWWQTEISTLPTKPHFPNAVFIEFDGTPKSGKFTLLELVEKTLQNSRVLEKLKARVFAQGEQLTSYGDYYMDNYLGSFLDEDDIPPILPKEGWVDGLFIQLHKELYFQRLIWSLMVDSDPVSPRIMLVERGPTDALIWQYTLAAHKGDKSFEIPDFFRPNLTNISYNACGLHALSARVDSVVIIGTSQDIAGKRHGKQDSINEGRVAKSPIFSDLSAWYGEWINKVFPNMHETYGTGLLSVDGSQSTKKNAPIISSYIEQVA